MRSPAHLQRIPDRAFTDIAIAWQRGTLQCILSGDGLRYALELRRADAMLRALETTDVNEAIRIAGQWRRKSHFGGEGT